MPFISVFGGQLNRMNTRTRFDTAPFAILSRTTACALVFCSGCLQHHVPFVDGYSIDDKGGAPMLVPNAVQDTNSEELHAVTVTIAAGKSSPQTQVRENSSIQGGVFSLQPVSSSNGMSWVVKSPSIT